MKWLFKIIIVMVLIGIFIIGRFFYVVHASSFDRVIRVNKKINNTNPTLTVGTYNLKSLAFKQEYLDAFKQDIHTLDLDIICLQEVDKMSFRSDNLDMVKELAQANDYPYYQFYTTMWIIDGYYGLGILSKYPITNINSQRLPNSLLKEPRIMTNTKIDYNGQSINIYNTHLSYQRDKYRQEQIEYLQAHVLSNEPSILMGDFNTWDLNEKITIAEMNNVNDQKQFLTFGNFYAVDDILYSNDFSLVTAGMQETSFSDHNLLYAQITLNP